MRYIIFIFLILIACEPNVVFEEALPPEIDAIDQIPEVFQGAFMCDSDSSRIYVDAFLAIHESYYKFYTTVEKVRETENCSIVAGGLYLPGRKSCIPFEYISEDSIMAKIYEQDTLFSFSDIEVAKTYKGRLFLNRQNERGHWITWMLSPESDGSMLLELIDVPDKKKSIDEISQVIHTRKTKKDKIQYIIKPSLVEFDKILKKGYTTECELLHPINMESGF